MKNKLVQLLQKILNKVIDNNKDVPFYINPQLTDGDFVADGFVQFYSFIANEDGLFNIQVKQEQARTSTCLTMRTKHDNVDVSQGSLGDWGWVVLTSPVAKGVEYTILYQYSATTYPDSPPTLHYYTRFYPYKRSF